MKSVMFQVPGKPQGKARGAHLRNSKTGGSFSYTPENTVLYENLVKAMYINQARGTRFEKDKPVAVSIVARFLPPASASKRNSGKCWMAISFL